MVWFDRQLTPVLSFEDDLDDKSDAPERRVLWPVLGWRVVVPTPVDRKFNAFQTAVLRMAQIERTAPVDVASLLHLEPDLVRFIQGELQSEGVLGLDGRPTRRGLELLELDEQPPELEDRAGWVFADPESGELWPRFIIGELPFADLDLESDHEPRLRRPRGRGPGAPVAVVMPDGRRAPQQPTTRAILRAAHLHRRSVARADRGHERAMKRVSHVSDHPHPFWVLLRFHADDEGQLVASGMLGSDAPVGFVDAVTERSNRDDRLRTVISRLLENTGDGLSELRNQAAFTVESELTTAIRRHPAVHTLLVATERAWLESQSEGSPPDKLDDVLVKAQKACEAILDDVLIRFPLRSPLPWRDLTAMAALVAESARGLGLPPLPKSMAGVRPGKIQHAAQGNAGLRPLALALVLGTLEHEIHPLRDAARSWSTLLAELDTLANWRDGRAAHYSRPRRGKVLHQPTREVTESCVYLTRRLARQLLLDAAAQG